MEELKIQCPELPKDNLKDVTNDSGLSTLEDFTKVEFVNFEAKREDLYRLSMDIEAYAVKNYVPLLATFETEALYKYVQKRYTDILKKIPHAWVIGGFDDPFLIPPDSVPATAEILSCLDTNIEKTTSVGDAADATEITGELPSEQLNQAGINSADIPNNEWLEANNQRLLDAGMTQE